MAMEMESCVLEELCTSLGGSEKLLNELRERLEDWLKLQPHLPQDVPKQVLEHFILGCKLSLQQAKSKLDMFYTMKRLVPELHANRDPELPGLDRLHKMMQIVYLPKLTPEKYRVCIFRPIADSYSDFAAADGFKYSLMLDEILMNDTKTRSLGNVYILDHSKINLGLFIKYTPPLIKKFEVAITEAYALRIKAFHHVNAGPVTDALISLIKSTVKPKLAAAIVVHGKQNYATLHATVPKSILPVEFDGEGPSMDDLTEFWCREVHKKRDWFREQEEIVANESVRPGHSVNSNDLFGFEGSFRKLELD